MGLVSILVVASMPVLKVLLLGALGGLLATPHMGILPHDARKHLNKLVFTVFTPALVFCNLVQAVTPANIIAWWYLPVNVIITFLIGGVLGLLVVKIFKPESHLERLTIACCSAGNVGNLPLVLIPAACMEPNSPFKPTQVCIGNGVAYVSFGLWIATLILWTFVYHMLKPTSVEIERHGDVNFTTLATNSLEDTNNHEANNEELMPMNASNHGDLSTLEKVVAFFVGGIPVFKQTLIGQGAPLRFVQDSLVTLGSAMLPSMILLLGGNLSQGLGAAKMKAGVVAGIVVAKLLILPILGICFVWGASYLRLIPSDPLFHLVLLMQYTMPTAMTIGIITQLFGAGEEASLILLWCYLASVVTITLWTMVFIWLLF